LTPDDRQLGHRLAAQFLEQHGGRRNLRRLAEHFFAGGLTEQARTYFLAAAELALANSDLDGALKCVQSGIDNQASGELLGGLRAVELQAHFWRDEWAEALACGQEALALLPKGSARWSAAAAVLMPTTSMSGQLELFRQLAAELPQVQPEPSAVPAYFGAVSYLAISTSLIGSRLEARQLIALLRHYLPSAGHPDGLIEQGLLTFSELVFRRTFVSDLWINYRLADAATRVTTISGDLRTLLFVQAYLGRSLTELGDFESAEQVLTTCLELSHRLNEPLLTAHVRVQYETLLLSTGDPTHLLQALESARLTVDNQRTNPLLRGQAMTNLADAQLRSGQLVEAELSARSAEGLLHDVPNSRLLALCMLAFSQLRLGRPEQALRLIGDARDRLTLHPGVDSKSVFLLVNTLIRQGCGDPAAAMAKQEAEDYFLEASQSIPDPQLRARYLQQAFAPRRLRELARS
jgi:tetratricopeptide (TPR) repeat protein